MTLNYSRAAVLISLLIPIGCASPSTDGIEDQVAETAQAVVTSNRLTMNRLTMNSLSATKLTAVGNQLSAPAAISRARTSTYAAPC